MSRNVAASAEPDESRQNDERERGSVRIRRVLELTRELLLRDHYADDRLLSANVREGLEEISLELVQLAGDQLQFELWIGGEKL